VSLGSIESRRKLDNELGILRKQVDGFEAKTKHVATQGFVHDTIQSKMQTAWNGVESRAATLERQVNTRLSHLTTVERDIANAQEEYTRANEEREESAVHVIGDFHRELVTLSKRTDEFDQRLRRLEENPVASAPAAGDEIARRSGCRRRRP
jgi:chromosome segregation ATPase